MVLVVQFRDRLSERLDTGCGTVLSTVGADIYFLWPLQEIVRQKVHEYYLRDGVTNLETSLNAVIDLGSSLTQVGPFVRVIGETMLVCLLRRPDYTGGRTRGIETGVRLVAFVRFTEVAVDAGAQF